MEYFGGACFFALVWVSFILWLVTEMIPEVKRSRIEEYMESIGFYRFRDGNPRYGDGHWYAYVRTNGSKEEYVREDTLLDMGLDKVKEEYHAI